MRQNKDFFKLCVDNGISFEKVSQNFDFRRFIVKMVDDDLFEQMLKDIALTMIAKRLKAIGLQTAMME